LFTPFSLRSLTLRNRVVISPMCQNAAEPDGSLGDWHFVHLGQFALGGAGLIFVESTAVAQYARINEFDVGLWNDSQIAPLARVARFVRSRGAALGVQLAHAGRKAGAFALCDGGEPLPDHLLAPPDRPSFVRVGPSAVPAGEEWTVPREMTVDDIAAVRSDFVVATQRANAAGVDVIELHFAHGYLVASFLSAQSNFRKDSYGGDREGRMRLALEIASDVRDAWPADKPLFCRLSVIDGAEGGWTEEDSAVLARLLGERGVDVIDCSSGGLTEATRSTTAPRGLGFQVPYAARIRREAGIATQAVGMIVDPTQANEIIAREEADLVALAREALYDPFWANHAAHVLGADPDFTGWDAHNGAYLQKRKPQMDALFPGRGMPG
jgi:2,4-dienoyl-CoA reductase-like NADH-dependent reductase (Old Yellow Enzyme family)